MKGPALPKGEILGDNNRLTAYKNLLFQNPWFRTLDHTDDDKANGFGSNPPEDTFFTLKKRNEKQYMSTMKELSYDRCDLARLFQCTYFFNTFKVYLCRVWLKLAQCLKPTPIFDSLS